MSQSSKPSWYSRNRELAWSMASGAALVLGWITELQAAPRLLSLTLYITAYLFGSIDLIEHQIEAYKNKKLKFDIDILMLVAAVGAAILGSWREGALLLFLFSLGHALQHYAMGRAKHAIEALRELAPTRATILRNTNGTAHETIVPIEEVSNGDTVVIKPGERIAVDGIVNEGSSGVNQAAVTGESIPVEKTVGDEVFAGTVNGDGTLLVTVTATVGDRTLDRVISLVAEARTQRAPSQEKVKRFEKVFVPAILVLDVLLIVLPPLLGVWTWNESFYRGMALLVAASPCALALGTPAAVLSGIAQGARRGVLIKGGAHLETLGSLNTIALDKTGTVTTGEPVVTDIVPFDGVTQNELLSLVAAVERRSQHPLARAVVKEAERAGVEAVYASDVQSLTGKGVVGRVDGTDVEVGTVAMFRGRDAGIPSQLEQAMTALASQGRMAMLARKRDSSKGYEWLGAIGLADEPRSGLKDTFAALRNVGVRKLVLLTGDNEAVARAIGTQYAFDEIHAALLPEGKLQVIDRLSREGPIAMVGDGVNDAPALARASIGIAMGGAGTAVALETADVALMADDLSRLPFAIGLSKATKRIIWQNLAISLGVIVLLIAATVSGVSGIGATVVFHEGSTLVVVANALRLLAYGDK